jgi:HK97 family phage prohead protease
MTETSVRPPVLPAVETRFAVLDECEIRSTNDNDIRFEGHAAVFDSPSEPLGSDRFIETIQRGAFRKAIPASDTRFLWNHASDAPLARSSVPSGPGSLRLAEDTRGLHVEAQFANTTLARDLRELVNTGVVREMSFAWPHGAARDEWTESEGTLRRSITEFTAIRDVSLVSFPAYPEANDAVMRALVCGTRIMEGDVVLEDDLRAISDKVYRGERFATAEERLIIDEAFARMNSLSPWMEERARRAFGMAATGTAPTDAEETEETSPADGRVTVVARERRHRFRQRQLEVHT